jgi:hypothetical protein
MLLPIKVGLLLRGDHSFAEVCAPLADELSRCFWVMDVQMGCAALNSLWLVESDEHKALWESLYWPVPAFKMTSTVGYRPGTVPLLAPHVYVDEASSYFAIDAPEEEALRRATDLASDPWSYDSILPRLDEVADLYLFQGDGWWQFFTGRAEWRERMRAYWPECRECPPSSVAPEDIP